VRRVTHQCRCRLGRLARQPGRVTARGLQHERPQRSGTVGMVFDLLQSSALLRALGVLCLYRCAVFGSMSSLLGVSFVPFSVCG